MQGSHRLLSDSCVTLQKPLSLADSCVEQGQSISRALGDHLSRVRLTSSSELLLQLLLYKGFQFVKAQCSMQTC